MNNRNRSIVLTASLGLVSVVGYWALHRHDAVIDSEITSPALKPDDTAKVIVNQDQHEVVTVRRQPDGKIVQEAHYVSRHAEAVEVKKDGSIVVQQRVWGTEFDPFFGVSFSSAVRFRLGVCLFFVERLDLAGSVSLRYDGHDPRVHLDVGYNVWRNTSLFVSVDNRKEISGGLFVRF